MDETTKTDLAREVSDATDRVRLETRVDELERRLKARALELETEIRAKERMNSRTQEAMKRAAEIEETASILHREAVSATAWANELENRLRAASEEAKHRESELKDARLNLQALRRKTDGHETHIDSLRAELEQALEKIRENEELVVAAARRLAEAEQIRREGIEAFEGAREAKIALEIGTRALVEKDPPAPSAPLVSVPPPPDDSTVPGPWQTRDEMKFLFWTSVALVVVVLLAASALFVRN